MTVEKAFRTITSPFRPLPNLVITGVARGGTDSLYKWLAQHPDVGAAGYKDRTEVCYYDMNRNRSMLWYRAHSPLLRRKYTLEKSPYYICHPWAMDALKKRNCKIIIIFRDPIKRAYSHFYTNRYYVTGDTVVEPIADFEEALELEESRLAGEWLKIIRDPSYFSFRHYHYSYLWRGDYRSMEKLWRNVFKDNLFVTWLERFSAIPAERARLFEWLDIKPIDYFPKTDEIIGLYPPLKSDVYNRVKERHGNALTFLD